MLLGGDAGIVGGGKQPDDPRCEVLPAASHFAWLYKYRSDLRKRKSPAFRVIESTLIALAFYFGVKKKGVRGTKQKLIKSKPLSISIAQPPPCTRP